MGARRTPVASAFLVLLMALTGCGSQTAPTAGATPGTNSASLNGTTPSPLASSSPLASPPGEPSVPSVTDDYHSDGVVTKSREGPPFAIIDPNSGDFVAGLGNGDVVIATVGIHGVGAAWGTKRALVTRSPEGIVARYDGPGELQPDARLDLGIASITTLVRSGLGDPEPLHLRLEVHLDASGLGRADVWIRGHHYRIAATEPPHTADPVVTAVVSAFREEDWSALYDLTVHLPGMTRADFVRSFGGNGSITSLEITGDTVYHVVDGVGRASTPAHVVATIGQRHLDRDIAVQLIYQESAWRFSSLSKRIDGS